MLSERDKSVVYSMCQTGMSLDTLRASFPKLDFTDIEAVYDEYKNESKQEAIDIIISCNCS